MRDYGSKHSCSSSADQNVEIGHEKAVFIHLLFFLCQEFLAALDKDNPRIVVVTVLLTVRERVMVFLRYALPHAMANLGGNWLRSPRSQRPGVYAGKHRGGV